MAALAFFTKASTMPGSFFPLSSLCNATPAVRMWGERNRMPKGIAQCKMSQGLELVDQTGGGGGGGWGPRRRSRRRPRVGAPSSRTPQPSSASALPHRKILRLAFAQGETRGANRREGRTPGDEQREATLLDRLGDRPIEGLARAARRRPSHLRVLKPKPTMVSGLSSLAQEFGGGGWEDTSSTAQAWPGSAMAGCVMTSSTLVPAGTCTTFITGLVTDAM